MSGTGKIYIVTFGCQMNAHDSLRIRETMLARGWSEAAGPGDADLVVVNTCSVREKARQKAASAVGALRRLKGRTRGRRPLVAVAGCVARQEGERWLARAPHVDIVMGPDAVVRVDRLVELARDGGGPVVDVEFDGGLPEDFAGPRREGGAAAVSSNLTIMKGCDCMCSFCIVPFVRGPERCRPARDVVEDVRLLVGRGAREIVLLGQAVNAWRHGGSAFEDLLGMVDAVPGVARVRYTSPYPGRVTPRLAECHAALASLCEHVHLPVQSGSDRVLAAMGRGYTADGYLRAVGLLRARRPGLAVSTDVIVGFPGETDEDFALTMRLVEEAGFDTMFSFMYSPRPGTKAAAREDDVPAGVKRERLAALHALSERITARRWREDLGADVEVLVEGEGRREGQLSGRTRKNRIVNFPRDTDRAIAPGDLVAVRIEEVLPHSLRGSLAALTGPKR